MSEPKSYNWRPGGMQTSRDGVYVDKQHYDRVKARIEELEDKIIKLEGDLRVEKAENGRALWRTLAIALGLVMLASVVYSASLEHVIDKLKAGRELSDRVQHITEEGAQRAVGRLKQYSSTLLAKAELWDYVVALVSDKMDSVEVIHPNTEFDPGRDYAIYCGGFWVDRKLYETRRFEGDSYRDCFEKALKAREEARNG